MIYFIVNTTSGTGQGIKVWKEIHQELKTREVDFKAFETKYAGHAIELAKKISALPGNKNLVIVGGDGTINEVLNGIVDFEYLRVGVIPNGSGNDFARGLKLPKDPIKNLNQILEVIDESENDVDCYTGIDLGQVAYEKDGEEQHRLFGISAGVGLDAIVCKRALTSKLKKALNKIKLGKLTYILLTVHTLFSMETSDMEMKMWNDLPDMEEDKDREYEITLPYKKLIFMAAMNQFAEGGGVPMAPKANCTDGKLSFSSASGIPKTKTFFCLPFLMAKMQKHIKGFDIVDGAIAKLHIANPMVLHADGEYCGEVTDVTFTCLPQKMKYLMKK